MSRRGCALSVKTFVKISRDEVVLCTDCAATSQGVSGNSILQTNVKGDLASLLASGKSGCDALRRLLQFMEFSARTQQS